MGVRNINNADTSNDTWKDALVDKYNRCMCCCSPECCSKKSCIQRWAVCGYCFMVGLCFLVIIFSPFLGILIAAIFLILIIIVIATGCCCFFCCCACCCRVHEIGEWLINDKNKKKYTRWFTKCASCCPCCCCCCIDAETLVDLRIKTSLETLPTEEPEPPKQVQAPEDIVIKRINDRVEPKVENKPQDNEISLDDSSSSLNSSLSSDNSLTSSIDESV